MDVPHIPQIDLANWMGNLPKEVKLKPLTWLSIPGSHNSGTCDLSNEAGNDAFCFNVAPVARRWATCQRLYIENQLYGGIRYLDFRLDFDENKDKIYITHFLRSKSAPMKCLETVKHFLKEHEHEMVIIDLQHYYHFNNSEHEQFLIGVIELFDKMICPVPTTIDSLTLDYLQLNKFQVILINRYNGCITCRIDRSLIFTSRDFPTYWPDTANSREVIEKAKTTVRLRRQFGYITQLVLTIRSAKHFVYLDLRNLYKSRLYRKSMEWLCSIRGGSQPNIIISDFIEFDNYSFPLATIRLNYLKKDESLSQLSNHSFQSSTTVSNEEGAELRQKYKRSPLLSCFSQ